MAAWLLIYRSVSAPVNRQHTAVAHDGRILAHHRGPCSGDGTTLTPGRRCRPLAVAALCARSSFFVTKELAAGSALRGPACQHHEKRAR